MFSSSSSSSRAVGVPSRATVVKVVTPIGIVAGLDVVAVGLFSVGVETFWGFEVV